MQVDLHFREPRLAALYDAFCAGRPDFAFYLHHVMSAASVLDVGCGTGELLRIARDQGHTGRLCGLDPAAAMLDVARTRADIEWVQGDLSSFDTTQRFELIVMTGHAFQVLLSDAEIRTALAAINRLLARDAHFIFETRNPAARAWGTWIPDNAIELPTGERMAHLVQRVDASFVTFTSTYTHPRWQEPLVANSTLRFVDVGTLDAMLADACLSVGARFGAWDGQPFATTSPEIITVAARRE